MTSSAVPTILVVDDDPSTRIAVSDYLSSQGLTVLVAEDGIAMQGVLGSAHVSIIVLDVMMPGKDGLELIKELRRTSNVGVIMLSAQGSERDRTLGLRMGADDYVMKPASPCDLLVRIRALLRRNQAKESPCSSGMYFQFEGWTFDHIRRTLSGSDGVLISLSGLDVELQSIFLENNQKYITSVDVGDAIYGDLSRRLREDIDYQIDRLRQKLRRYLGKDVILSVSGKGYLFYPAVIRIDGLITL